MKIRLLFAFIVLSLASCSSDDNSDGKDPSENNGERKLREIIQTDFNEDGSVFQTSKIYFDDNDRALSQFQYDATGALITKREFTYNNGGQVENMVYYTAATGIDTPNYSYTVAYDANNKVTTVNDSFLVNGSPMTSVMTYVYNPNGSILMTRTLSTGDSSTTLYDVNTNGQVYKKTSSSGTVEQITYTGENIFSYSNGESTSTFVYDNEDTPKGQQHNVVVNQYNGNMVNTLMLGGFTSIGLGKDKYAIHRDDSNGNKYDYVYEFDNEGYPIKLRYFKNEASVPFSIREIYYK